MIKSPIAYPGAKGKVCDKLMAMLPHGIKDWREPFFGGGSVTIAFLQSPKGADCKRFVVGDKYTEVYYFWKAVQEHPQELIDYATQWFTGKMITIDKLRSTDKNDPSYPELFELVTQTEAKSLWSWVQSVDVEKLTEVERGARFFLSSKMSFSGVADSGGMSKDRVLEFDVNKLDNLLEVSKLLQKIEIYNQSYEATMADVDKDNSFVFLDPPYITQEVGHLYGRNGSTHNDFTHKGLADLCMSLPCKWLMTIDDCVRARKLYRGAHISEFYIPYTMTSLTGRENRLNGEELIISNYYDTDEEATSSWETAIPAQEKTTSDFWSALT